MIPAYNEEKTIASVIKEIPRNIKNIDKIEILVISDGSTDNTVEAALRAGASKVLKNKCNMGLAYTFQKGLTNALKMGAGIIVNTDADGQYNQNEIPRILEPIIENKADIVIGDRQVTKLSFMKWGNKYGNLFGSWVIRRLTRTKTKDASSGFRALNRDAAQKINIYFSHTYTHETIIQAKYKNLTVIDVPIEFRPRESGKSKLINNLFGHIRLSAITIIRTILLYKPLKVLFYTGILVMTPGIILGIRFLYYNFYLGTGGKIQSLILTAILIIIGFIIIVVGILGDLISNNRKLNEKILYHLRKHE